MVGALVLLLIAAIIAPGSAGARPKRAATQKLCREASDAIRTTIETIRGECRAGKALPWLRRTCEELARGRAMYQLRVRVIEIEWFEQNEKQLGLEILTFWPEGDLVFDVK